MIKFHSFYELLFKQLNNFFFLSDEEKEIILTNSNKINERFLYCCKANKDAYYELTKINPYHACQYTLFLYFCANTIFKSIGNCQICDKIYNLSKIVSSSDLYYEIELPEIFRFGHPVGTVMGRAKYANYFHFAQNCTVGNNKGKYPEFSEFVSMCSGAKVLGNCKIGRNVIISANTYVKDCNIPDNSIVFNGISKEGRKEGRKE